jgi:hypothetical protein
MVGGALLGGTCSASQSARRVFVGNFVANFVEREVDNVSDKVSDKETVGEGGAKP